MSLSKQHWGTFVLAGCASLSLLALNQRPAQADHDDWHHFTERERIEQGFRIAPVPLKCERHEEDMVGLGSYLVNAIGGCNDCHTNPSYTPAGDPFMGKKKQVNAAHYLAGGQLFGPFVSRNLTPEHGLPAGHTLAEFKNILRTGIDYDKLHPQISPLLQVMPWPTYQSMSDHDIEAIYAYLKAIPPANPGS